MADASTYIFSYKELVEILVKNQGIHQGLWGIYIKFGIGAANVGDTENGIVLPSAIVPVQEIGIQVFDKANNLTVDAAVVNPSPSKPSKRRQKR